MKHLRAFTASPFGGCTVHALAVAAFILFLFFAYKFVHPDQFIITAIITLAVWLSRRFLDHQSFRSLGVDGKHPGDLLNGFVAVLIPLLIVALVQYLTGWATLKGWGMDAAGTSHLPAEVLGSLFSVFVIAGLTAWREELLFRGYLLDNLQRGTGWLWGITLSSVLFGFLHIILTPNASSLTTAQQISILIYGTLAGLILAGARLRSGSLWMPVGWHLGWNFLISPVFGLSLGNNPSLMAWEFSGPAMLDRLWFLDFGLRALFILLLSWGWIILVTHRRNAKPPSTSS